LLVGPVSEESGLLFILVEIEGSNDPNQSCQRRHAHQWLLHKEPKINMPTRAANPDSLNPDPAFQVNPDPIRIQVFDDQNLRKKYR
jgi:hypothetical protein